MRFPLFSSSGTYSPLSCASVHGKISELEAAYWLKSSYSAIHKGPFKKKQKKTEPSEDVWWGKNLYNAALNYFIITFWLLLMMMIMIMIIIMTVIIIITYFLSQQVFPPPHRNTATLSPSTTSPYYSEYQSHLCVWLHSTSPMSPSHLNRFLDQYLGGSNLFCPIKNHWYKWDRFGVIPAVAKNWSYWMPG